MSLDGTTNPAPDNTPPAGDPPPADPPKDDDTPPPQDDDKGGRLLSGDDGGEDKKQTWVDRLNYDHQKMAKAKGWDDPTDVIKGYAELEARVGQLTAQGVKVPGKDAPAEDVAAYRKAIGVPEKASEYIGDWKPAEGVDISEGLRDAFLTKMHEAGATPAAVRIALDTYNDLATGGQEELDKRADAALAETKKALAEEYGPDKVGEKVDLAQRAMRLAFEERDLAEFKQLRLQDGSYVGENRILFRAMAAFGAAISERGGLPGATSPSLPGSITTAEQAIARKKEISADKDLSTAAVQRSHPKHDDVVKELIRLDRIITDAQLEAGHIKGGPA